MAFAGFHGLPRELQVNVLECNIMSDRDSSMRQTEWYLSVQYGSKLFVTNSTYTDETKKQLMELAHFPGVWFEDADGGINPKFQEKIVFEHTEASRELTVVVARSKDFADVFGTATIKLDAVLEQGCGEFNCPLQKTSSGSRVGGLKLRLKLKHAKTNTFGGPRAGGYNIQAAPRSYNYPYNLAAYPPFSYPPANPIPYYYLPPPSPYPQPPQQPLLYPQPQQQPLHYPQPQQQPLLYPQPQQQPLLYPQPQQQALLYPQIILSHGIGGVVSAFVDQLFQNLSSNLSQYYGGLGLDN